MSDSPAIIPDAASRFFDNHLDCLRKASIPEKQRRWYVKRVEAFIKAQNGHKIKTLSGDDIARYFEMIGRENRLSGWQFRQWIDAIRILYCDLLATPSARAVDWRYWLDSATELDAEHPVLGCQLRPDGMCYLKMCCIHACVKCIRMQGHSGFSALQGRLRRSRPRGPLLQGDNEAVRA
jgi:hypothetical protein